MVSQISGGVQVSVETFYKEGHSIPLERIFVFGYKITLHNSNPFPVKLISRHWKIVDSCGINQKVEGDGVVGVQPVLGFNKTYHYVSGCSLLSEMGKMSGAYIFEQVQQKKYFHVIIPAFQLIAPFKLN